MTGRNVPIHDGRTVLPFRIAVNDVTVGYFSSVDGITTDEEVAPRAAPRMVLHGLVLVEKQQHVLRHWAYAGAQRPPTPQGQIQLVDTHGRVIRRWQFYEAYPCRWCGPGLDGDGATVEIALGRLIRL